LQDPYLGPKRNFNWMAQGRADPVPLSFATTLDVVSSELRTVLEADVGDG
jgi:hypothetical protein